MLRYEWTDWACQNREEFSSIQQKRVQQKSINDGAKWSKAVHEAVNASCYLYLLGLVTMCIPYSTLPAPLSAPSAALPFCAAPTHPRSST